MRPFLHAPQTPRCIPVCSVHSLCLRHSDHADQDHIAAVGELPGGVPPTTFTNLPTSSCAQPGVECVRRCSGASAAPVTVYPIRLQGSAPCLSPSHSQAQAGRQAGRRTRGTAGRAGLQSRSGHLSESSEAVFRGTQVSRKQGETTSTQRKQPRSSRHRLLWNPPSAAPLRSPVPLPPQPP